MQPFAGRNPLSPFLAIFPDMRPDGPSHGTGIGMRVIPLHRNPHSYNP